ncbi:unnamed protein product [Calicophoron daubneyi]|uniref:Vasohibin-2 n=1 Tax=Calicophoron daubneyi TaxID=300641 RepID=A0AAV2TBG5_CALDB
MEWDSKRKQPLRNKSGFPIDASTISLMFEHCKHANKTHVSTISALQDICTGGISESLPTIDVPKLELREHEGPFQRVERIQSFINQFKYNYTGLQFFEVNRKATLTRLSDLAKLMVQAPLPIKCLEATVLALYLTQGQKDLKRFTIGFMSECEGQICKHVVLGIYAEGRFGALGLSRRSDLMYKPLEFLSLSSLIQSYASAYTRNYHTLIRVKLGLPIPHNPHMFETIPWKGIIIYPARLKRPEEMRYVLDQYARIIRGQVDTLYLRSPQFRLPSLSSASSTSPDLAKKNTNKRSKWTVSSTTSNRTHSAKFKGNLLSSRLRRQPIRTIKNSTNPLVQIKNPHKSDENSAYHLRI